MAWDGNSGPGGKQVTCLTRLLLAVCAGMLTASPPAAAHEGGLDRNGCHYDRSNGRYHCHKETVELAPNPDRSAGAKKSRENICHDKSSSNYRTIRYFISYRDMDACLASGGVAYRH
jgi:hypothetical protein